MPPVAKTSMPARRAQIIVAATVVAPVQPSAERDGEVGAGELADVLAAAARRARSGSRPTWMRPALMAMVAGAAPAARTSASTARAVSRLAGKGMPWVMMVDSSATSGRRAAMASATSVEKARGGVMGPRSDVAGGGGEGGAERGLGVEAVGAGGEVGGDEDVAGAGDAGRPRPAAAAG